MTSRRALTAVAVFLFLIAAPAAVVGQTIYAGAGLSAPTGEYKSEDTAKTGWLATAGLLFDIGESGLWAGVEGFYGENKHDAEGNKTNPYGTMAVLGYTAGDSESVSPYFWGGFGLMVHKFTSDSSPTDNDSSTDSGYQAGAGVDVPVGSNVGIYVEGRFMGSRNTNFVAFLAGLGIGVG